MPGVPSRRKALQLYAIFAVLCLVSSGTAAPYLAVASLAVDSHLVRAAAFLLTPFAFAMWIVATVRSLHLAGLGYWSLASTYIALVCVGVATALACISWIIWPDGATDDLKEAVGHAAGVVGLGGIFWCGWYNWRRTGSAPLAVSVTALQMVTSAFIALLMLLVLLRDRARSQ